AVMMPQAMKAAMFGMIMPDRNVPNLCTRTRAPPAARAGADVVVMMFSFSRVGGEEVIGGSRQCRGILRRRILRGRAGARRVVGGEGGGRDAPGVFEAVLRG